METKIKSKELQKLSKLCAIVNRRYSSGLNDDDQVGEMFSYEKKNKDKVRVLVGWNTYKAISLNEIKERLKGKHEETENDYKFWIGYEKYKVLKPVN